MQFTLTESAKKQIKELASQGKMLHNIFRVQIKAGGCSGFEYIFKLDTTLEKDDLVIDLEGAQCVIDDASITLIDGAELDYQIDLGGEKFTVKNPNAAAKCGCGNSFSI